MIGIVCVTEAGHSTPIRDGGKWYKGDLHAHSNYSDGYDTVGEMIKVAEGLGLEFLVLTDHDTTAHWNDPDCKSEKMVLLYGVEWGPSRGLRVRRTFCLLMSSITARYT